MITVKRELDSRKILIVHFKAMFPSYKLKRQKGLLFEPPYSHVLDEEFESNSPLFLKYSPHMSLIILIKWTNINHLLLTDHLLFPFFFFLFVINQGQTIPQVGLKLLLVS